MTDLYLQLFAIFAVIPLHLCFHSSAVETVLFEFQIAKKNRLMVYRQTVKQEMAEVGGTSTDNDPQMLNSSEKSVASFKVGRKKLVIPSSSSTTAAVDSAETKPKLLLLDHVGKDRKKCDKVVDSDNNNNNNDDSVKTANTYISGTSVDVSKIVINVDDMKLDSTGAAVSSKCCSRNRIVAADSKSVETDAKTHADDTAQQTDTVSVPQKGCGATKKPAAGGRKGISFIIHTDVRDLA